MKDTIKKDTALILCISVVSAIVYIVFEGIIMDYGRQPSHPLLLRCLPVFIIQFGMSCLGPLIVIIKNKDSLSDYGLVRNNLFFSIIGCAVKHIGLYFDSFNLGYG